VSVCFSHRQQGRAIKRASPPNGRQPDPTEGRRKTQPRRRPGRRRQPLDSRARRQQGHASHRALLLRVRRTATSRRCQRGPAGSWPTGGPRRPLQEGNAAWRWRAARRCGDGLWISPEPRPSRSAAAAEPPAGRRARGPVYLSLGEAAIVAWPESGGSAAGPPNAPPSRSGHWRENRSEGNSARAENDGRFGAFAPLHSRNPPAPQHLQTALGEAARGGGGRGTGETWGGEKQSYEAKAVQIRRK